jgi:hypothetical protein
VPPLGDNKVQVTLRCEQGEQLDGDDGLRTFWNDVWREQASAELSAGELGTRVTFKFRPPAELPPSESSKFKWSISLSAHGPDMSFSELYEVHVASPLALATRGDSYAAER